MSTSITTTGEEKCATPRIIVGRKCSEKGVVRVAAKRPGRTGGSIRFVGMDVIDEGGARWSRIGDDGRRDIIEHVGTMRIEKAYFHEYRNTVEIPVSKTVASMESGEFDGRTVSVLLYSIGPRLLVILEG